MQPRLALAGLMAGVLTTAGFGQILPGHSIATVIVTGQPSEMYDIDHEAGTASPLTLSTALAAEGVNCVLMTSPVTGFVGTNPVAPATANVYGIVVTGNTVTETLLNTTPLAGSNVAQLTVVGGRLYFTTQTNGVIGTLQSVPVGGGAVTADLDLASVGAANLVNACTSIGSKIYVATFNSGSAAAAVNPGELFEFDTVTSTARLAMTLPTSLGYMPSATTYCPGIVNMIEDPRQPGKLALQGVYDDLIVVDPIAGTVISQNWPGRMNPAGTGLASTTVNSFAFDPVAQDFVIGTRNGAIERWVGNQVARQVITGIGTNPTLTSNSVTGLAYMPFGSGSDASYGSGCGGNDGWIPTDSSFGAPIAGDPNFKLGLFSINGGDPVLLLMDFQNTAIGAAPLPLDLTPFGAPGCRLLAGNLLTQLVLTTGTGTGGGRAVKPLPIPAFAVGFTLYRQWVELQLSPTNALGMVVSNARQMTVQ